MISFVFGAVVGAVLTVAVPAVYKFVAKQYASARAKIDSK